MNELWVFSRFLLDVAHCRARKALRGEPESGALSLEWIFIAVIVAIAAGVVGLIINHEIKKQAAKLP